MAPAATLDFDSSSSLSTLTTVDSLNPKYLEALFFTGPIPLTACLFDPRFSAAIYIPKSYTSLSRIPLVVLIHGTLREASEVRNDFANFAEQHQCAILAPLFPQGLIDPNDTDNYKFLKFHNIRFDHVLLNMVAELKQRWPKVNDHALLMQGFSGGAQFVHRFAYLYPELLRGVVICAPGNITPLDIDADYPAGVRDLELQFQRPLDRRAMQALDVLFLIGEDDTSATHLIARGKGAMNSRIDNRHDELHRLEISWRDFGINTSLEVVAGAAHEGPKMYEKMERFFERNLSLIRACDKEI